MVMECVCFIRFPSSRAGNWNVCVVILLSGKIERFCICASLGTDSDWQRWRWTFKEIGLRCCDVILLTAYSMIHYCHYCHFHSVPPYADPPDQWMFYLVDNESYGSINDDPELSMKWLQWWTKLCVLRCFWFIPPPRCSTCCLFPSEEKLC